jgi:hypothetical protein
MSIGTEVYQKGAVSQSFRFEVLQKESGRPKRIKEHEIEAALIQTLCLLEFAPPLDYLLLPTAYSQIKEF